MKATTIALDLMKDTDGTFKILELNTNVGFWPMSHSAYADVAPLANYISSSGATNLHYIGDVSWGNSVSTDNHLINDVKVPTGSLHGGADRGRPIFEHIKHEISESSYVTSWTDHFVSTTANSIPFVANTDANFIIRNAYDNTALVDTEYAANTTQFLQLVRDYCTGSNAVSFPASYVAPSGSEAAPIDTIDTGSIRNNGIHPNYLIKLSESSTGADNYNYPKLYYCSSSTAVQYLKDNLADGEILQEFIFNSNDLISGKAKTYRVTGMLCGSNLDTVQFFDPYIISNIEKVFTDVIDYETTHSINVPSKLETYERPQYIQKISNGSLGVNSPNITSFTKTVRYSDNQEIYAHESASIGTALKTYAYTGLLDDESNKFTWSGSFVEGSSLGSFTSSSIVTNDSGNAITVLDVLHMDDGSKIHYHPRQRLFAIKPNENFIRLQDTMFLESGSRIVYYNDDATLTSKGITDIKRTIHDGKVSYLDVEENDNFLIVDTNGDKLLAANTSCYCWQSFGSCFYYAGQVCNQGTCTVSPGCHTSSPFCTVPATIQPQYTCGNSK